MELRQLRNFLVIADAGSFTRAAARIGVAQPALSRDIRLLELELATTLFDRNGRGVSLTREGAAFLASVADHVGALDSAKLSMLSRRPDPSGPIRIGWTGAISFPLSARVIAEFTRRFPNSELRAIGGSSAQIQDWVANDRVDIGVMNSERPAKGYLLQTLMQAPLHFVAKAVADDRVSETKITFAEAATHPLFIHSRQNALGRIVESCAREHNISLRIYAVVDDFYAVRSMIRDGHAATIIPRSLLIGNTSDDNFVVRRVIEPSLDIYFLMAVSKAKRSDPVVNSLSEIIRAETEAALLDGRIEGSLVQD